MERPLPTEAAIRSHRPGIGPLVVAYKKLVRWLIRPYLRTVFEAHRRELEAQGQRAEEARQAAAEDLAALRAECQRLQQQLATQDRPTVGTTRVASSENRGTSRRFDPYYPAFLERFGPAPEERRHQLEHYVAILETAVREAAIVESDAASDRIVVDLGCGRGELLAQLAQRGVTARGVDSNAASHATAIDQGLDVKRVDVLEFLREQPPASLGSVSCLGLVEHLGGDAIVELFELCHSRLAPGAALVVEAVNPLSVPAVHEFHRDLTGLGLLHPETARFLLREIGFPTVDLQFLQPSAPDLRPSGQGEAKFVCEAYVVIAHR